MISHYNRRPGRTVPRQAWIGDNVPQCVSCRSKQLSAVIAVLMNAPNPSDDEVSQAMANACGGCKAGLP